MGDRGKVIKGLETCLTSKYPHCDECGYDGYDMRYNDLYSCRLSLMADALALLKAQEPRVMTWEEAQANVNNGPFIIVEIRYSTGSELCFGVLVDDSYKMSDGSLLTLETFGLLLSEYGKHIRLWTSRPTDEQREATPWQ